MQSPLVVDLVTPRKNADPTVILRTSVLLLDLLLL
jgi:hypothetical protein